MMWDLQTRLDQLVQRGAGAAQEKPKSVSITHPEPPAPKLLLPSLCCEQSLLSSSIYFCFIKRNS